MIVTHIQAKELLEANKKFLKETEISLDLNKTLSKIKIQNNEFIFPDNQKLNESQLKKPIKDDKVCFLIRDNSLVKIQLFSDETNKFYKLVPTKDAPTIEISGIRMHATKDMTPTEDTKRKIETIAPIHGIVLDTCMGMGYTAIASSKLADFVITCERDENVLEIAKYNPWSQELFTNKKISVMKTNVFDEIKIFKSNMFDVVIHDPPRLTLATELYSLEFYKQIFRVLKNNGKLYHYTGNPGSKNRHINLIGNVSKRLKQAGFKNIEKVHYGLKAIK
ncbi:MAG TPA: SAM-dependent methyltransferase [Candidatus Nanoarchaeia archaeon]|nr:SAM-dependent methyltransferase [Candidatus Nanoarchaeia archaeon]